MAAVEGPSCCSLPAVGGGDGRCALAGDSPCLVTSLALCCHQPCRGQRWPRCLASLSTMLKLVLNLKLQVWLNRDGGHKSEGEDMKSL